ncbi:MAG: response regulator [Ignavibacteriae bacterium]|nr:response regulator [Ignavibacteriota bacterium]
MTLLKNILLVEDNTKDIELTLAALKNRGLLNRVVTARDGIEALEYLRCTGRYANRITGNPAVILLDIKMPRMDGITALRTIRADATLSMIPIVMLTSSREDPDLRQCYAAGVNAFVVKPVGFQSFMDAVQDLGVFWALINEPPPDNA